MSTTACRHRKIQSSGKHFAIFINAAKLTINLRQKNIFIDDVENVFYYDPYHYKKLRSMLNLKDRTRRKASSDSVQGIFQDWHKLSQ